MFRVQFFDSAGRQVHQEDITGVKTLKYDRFSAVGAKHNVAAVFVSRFPSEAFVYAAHFVDLLDEELETEMRAGLKKEAPELDPLFFSSVAQKTYNNSKTLFGELLTMQILIQAFQRGHLRHFLLRLKNERSEQILMR